jgi:putative flippase GtrA
MPLSITKLANHRVTRWLLVGALFAGLGLGLLKLFFEILGWPYWFSTLLQAEICTLLRFLVNDRWVFGQRTPTWQRLWQYHVANAGGFAVWWVSANLLQWNGVNYLLAAILAMCCSVVVSILSNFLWVWRKRTGEVTPTHPVG